MAIKKQEFYEGAALHILARSGRIAGLRYDQPFFMLRDGVLILFKYSTRNRSPWAFTFTLDERTLLETKAKSSDIVLGLGCGSDGIAAITYEEFGTVAASPRSPAHISCYRDHGEQYEVNGPAGRLDRKVPPSRWPNILAP
jgi:hypothetical protein